MVNFISPTTSQIICGIPGQLCTALGNIMSRIASAVASCFGCSREGTAPPDPLVACVTVLGSPNSVAGPHSNQDHRAIADPLVGRARVLAVTDQPPANVNESPTEHPLFLRIPPEPTYKTLEECQAALAAYSSRSEKDPVAELIAKSQRIDDITPLDTWLEKMETANTTLEDERKSLRKLQRMRIDPKDPHHSEWETTKTAEVDPTLSLFSENKTVLETQILKLEYYLNPPVKETTAEETPSPTSLQDKIRSLGDESDRITSQLQPLTGLDSLTQRLILTKQQKTIKGDISVLLTTLQSLQLLPPPDPIKPGPQITEIAEPQAVLPSPPPSIWTNLWNGMSHSAFSTSNLVIATAKVPLINPEDLEIRSSMSAFYGTPFESRSA